MINLSMYPTLPVELQASATRDELVLGNLRLVIHIAKRYAHGCVQKLDEYIAAGYEGLIHSANTFDASKASFVTHASYWVHAMIKRCICDYDGVLRLPWRVFCLKPHVMRLAGEGLSVEEIAQELGATVKMVKSIISVNEKCELIDELHGGDDCDPAVTAERASDVSRFERVLTEKQRHVLIGKSEGKTNKVIGVELGITGEAVRLIECKALGVLSS